MNEVRGDGHTGSSLQEEYGKYDKQLLFKTWWAEKQFWVTQNL